MLQGELGLLEDSTGQHIETGLAVVTIPSALSEGVGLARYAPRNHKVGRLDGHSSALAPSAQGTTRGLGIAGIPLSNPCYTLLISLRKSLSGIGRFVKPVTTYYVKLLSLFNVSTLTPGGLRYLIWADTIPKAAPGDSRVVLPLSAGFLVRLAGGRPLGPDAF